jgi:hypothetical protein
VTITAFGTTRSGLRHSSARWRVASSPESMNCGVERPVRNDMPSGQPPDPFTSLAQISRESACISERAGQAMVMTTKVDIESRTRAD